MPHFFADPKKAVLNAIKRGNLAALQRLIPSQLPVDVDLHPNSDSPYTPLHAVTSEGRGRDDMVLYLLSCGASIDKQKYQGRGFTPLHLAVINSDEKSVKILYEHGARLDIIATSDISAGQISSPGIALNKSAGAVADTLGDDSCYMTCIFSTCCPCFSCYILNFYIHSKRTMEFLRNPPAESVRKRETYCAELAAAVQRTLAEKLPPLVDRITTKALRAIVAERTETLPSEAMADLDSKIRQAIIEWAPTLPQEALTAIMSGSDSSEITEFCYNLAEKLQSEVIREIGKDKPYIPVSLDVMKYAVGKWAKEKERELREKQLLEAMHHPAKPTTERDDGAGSSLAAAANGVGRVVGNILANGCVMQ